jgi:hypothetical protein
MTTMIYTSFKKAKAKKPTSKQRELADAWDKMMQKYEPKKPVLARKDDGFTYSLGASARRETPKIPSLPFTGGACPKKETQMYTGDKIKGIGTMHKSNSVPVFSDEEAIAIATMRRN